MLQRVTGVQITGDSGTGNAISVWGLAPSFVQTELNGRVLVSGGGRTFNFLSLSPDFVRAVVVEKSPTASMIDGGLSGTVDVRTAKPLHIGKNTIAGRVEGVNSSLHSGVGPRVAAIGNFVDSDRTFGLSLGGAYERLINRSYMRNGYGAETGVEANEGVYYNHDGDLNDVYTFDHGQEFATDTGVRERYSAIAGLQWRPSPDFEVYGDGLWTRFRDQADSLQATNRSTNIAPSSAGAKYGVVSSSIDTGFLGQLEHHHLARCPESARYAHQAGQQFRSDAGSQYERPHDHLRCAREVLMLVRALLAPARPDRTWRAVISPKRRRILAHPAMTILLGKRDALYRASMFTDWRVRC